jgi:hypothetical protein
MEHSKSAGALTEVCGAAPFDSPDSKMRGQNPHRHPRDLEHALLPPSTGNRHHYAGAKE